MKPDSYVLVTTLATSPIGEEFITVIPTTVKTLNIGTPRPATVVVLNIKQFNFTMK